MTANTPLLEARGARIDVSGIPAIDGLTLKTTGERVLVLGAAVALFEAACGMRPVGKGELLVHGTNAALALRAGQVAGAVLDPPLPPTWSVLAYAEWSARLCGHGRKASRALATDAIERMRMEKIAKDPLGKIAPHGRRAAVIAGAIATGARTLILCDPLAALPDEAARNLGGILVQALADRTWAVFAARVPVLSPLAAAADDALVVVGSEIAAQGAPAEVAARARSYAVRVHGPVSELARIAEARGAKVTLGGEQEHRLTIDLGEGLSTRDLLTMANDAQAVIVELTPVARAFA